MTRLTGLVLLLSMLLAPAPVWSAPPALTGSELSISSEPPVGSPTRLAIEKFVTYHFDQITSGDPGAVKEGRDQLSATLRKPDATPVFQQLFLKLAEPHVRQAVSGDNVQGAINALMVIRWVRTPEAFELVRAQCDSKDQSDVRVRAAAANLLPNMVKAGAIPPSQLDGAARRLRETAERESDWVALARCYAALAQMAASASSAKLETEAMNIRLELVKALRAGTSRSLSPEGRGAVSAVYRGLVDMRDQVLTMNQTQRGQVASVLLPVLDQVDGLPESGGDERLQKEIAGAKGVSRTLRSLLPKSGR